MSGELRASIRAVLANGAWWRHQGWMATTEVLMGFLAAWALLQSLAATVAALGLALAFAVNGALLWLLDRLGRGAGIAAAVALSGLAVAALVLPVGASWWALCAVSGGLLAFRDHQSARSLAWLPVKARRYRGSNSMALSAAAVAGVSVVALALLAAGVLTQWWTYAPQAIALLGACALLPGQVRRLGPRRTVSTRYQLPGQVRGLLRLQSLFNAVAQLGRRLILPMLVVMLGQRHGLDRGVYPLLGGLLGMMGLLGLVAMHVAARVRDPDPQPTLLWSSRAALAGWLLVASAVLGATYLPSLWPLAVLGWLMVEVASVTWSVSSIDALRLAAIGPLRSDARMYRRALADTLLARAGGGSVACAAVAVVSGPAAPLVLAAMAVVCWTHVERAHRPPRAAVIW